MKYKELFDKAKLDPSAKERIEDKVYMLKFKMQVGKKEVHQVNFKLNQFLGTVDINVDDKRVIRKLLVGPLFRRSWSFQLNVGEEEKHIVKIIIVKSLVPFGLRTCKAWAYIDDILVGEYDGEFSIKSAINKKVKIVASISILITLVVVVAVFGPAKIGTRFDFEVDENVVITGETRYFLENDRDYRFTVENEKDIEYIMEYISNLNGIRCFGNSYSYKPLLYSDHDFYISFTNMETGEHLTVTLGKFITVREGSIYKRFLLIPRLEEELIDQLVYKFTNPEDNPPITELNFT